MSKDKYIDSSDDELTGSEVFFERNKNILSLIDNTKDIDEKCLISIGFQVQNLGHSFFEAEKVKDQYKKFKDKYLRALTSEEYNKFAGIFESFIKEELPSIIKENSELKEKDYIKLFTHIIGNRASLPNGFSLENAGLDKDDVLNKIRGNSKLKQVIRSFAPPLEENTNLGLKPTSNGIEFFTQSALLNRYSKSQSRDFGFIEQENRKYKKNVTIKFANLLDTFQEDLTFFTPSNKISHYLPNLSRYLPKKEKNESGKKEDFDKIKKYVFNELREENKEKVIDGIYNIIKGDIDQFDNLSDIDKILATDLCQLIFITEVQRNPSAIFTGYMLLELLKQGNLDNPKEKEKIVRLFPMAMEQAVEGCRYLNYGSKHAIDFADGTKAKAMILLKIQGAILSEYDKKMFKNSSLQKIVSTIALLNSQSSDYDTTKLFEHISNIQDEIGNRAIKDEITQLFNEFDKTNDLGQKSIDNIKTLFIKNIENDFNEFLKNHKKVSDRYLTKDFNKNDEYILPERFLNGAIENFKNEGNFKNFKLDIIKLMKRYQSLKKYQENEEVFLDLLNNISYETDKRNEEFKSEKQSLRQTEKRIVDKVNPILEKIKQELEKNLESENYLLNDNVQKIIAESIRSMQQNALTELGVDGLEINIGNDLNLVELWRINSEEDKNMYETKSFESPDDKKKKKPKIDSKKDKNLTKVEEDILGDGSNFIDIIKEANPGLDELISGFSTNAVVESNLDTKDIDLQGRLAKSDEIPSGSVSFITEKDHVDGHARAVDSL